MKNKFKTIISCALLLLCVFSFTACGDKKESITNLKVTSTTSGCEVTFTEITDAVKYGYKLYKGTIEVASGYLTNGFIITDLENGNYSITIYALNDDGDKISKEDVSFAFAVNNPDLEKLNKVENIKAEINLSEEKLYISFDKVDNAQSYQVVITKDNKVILDKEFTDSFYIDNYERGTYKVSITAKTTNTSYLPSDASEYEFTLIGKLPDSTLSPVEEIKPFVNVQESKVTIVFDDVENASSYRYVLGKQNSDAIISQGEIVSGQVFENIEPGDYFISIFAVGDNLNYFESSERTKLFTVSAPVILKTPLNTPSNISLNIEDIDYTFTFDSVPNADYYTYELFNMNILYYSGRIETNSLKISLNTFGEYTLYIQAHSDDLRNSAKQSYEFEISYEVDYTNEIFKHLCEFLLVEVGVTDFKNDRKKLMYHIDIDLVDRMTDVFIENGVTLDQVKEFTKTIEASNNMTGEEDLIEILDSLLEIGIDSYSYLNFFYEEFKYQSNINLIYLNYLTKIPSYKTFENLLSSNYDMKVINNTTSVFQLKEYTVDNDNLMIYFDETSAFLDYIVATMPDEFEVIEQTDNSTFLMSQVTSAYPTPLYIIKYDSYLVFGENKEILDKIFAYFKPKDIALSDREEINNRTFIYNSISSSDLKTLANVADDLFTIYQNIPKETRIDIASIIMNENISLDSSKIYELKENIVKAIKDSNLTDEESSAVFSTLSKIINRLYPSLSFLITDIERLKEDCLLSCEILLNWIDSVDADFISELQTIYYSEDYYTYFKKELIIFKTVYNFLDYSKTNEIDIQLEVTKDRLLNLLDAASLVTGQSNVIDYLKSLDLESISTIINSLSPVLNECADLVLSVSYIDIFNKVDDEKTKLEIISTVFDFFEGIDDKHFEALLDLALEIIPKNVGVYDYLKYFNVDDTFEGTVTDFSSLINFIRDNKLEIISIYNEASKVADYLSSKGAKALVDALTVSYDIDKIENDKIEIARFVYELYNSNNESYVRLKRLFSALFNTNTFKSLMNHFNISSDLVSTSFNTFTTELESVMNDFKLIDLESPDVYIKNTSLFNELFEVLKVYSLIELKTNQMSATYNAKDQVIDLYYNYSYGASVYFYVNNKANHLNYTYANENHLSFPVFKLLEFMSDGDNTISFNIIDDDMGRSNYSNEITINKEDLLSDLRVNIDYENNVITKNKSFSGIVNYTIYEESSNKEIVSFGLHTPLYFSHLKLILTETSANTDKVILKVNYDGPATTYYNEYYNIDLTSISPCDLSFDENSNSIDISELSSFLNRVYVVNPANNDLINLTLITENIIDIKSLNYTLLNEPFYGEDNKPFSIYNSDLTIKIEKYGLMFSIVFPKQQAPSL